MFSWINHWGPGNHRSTPELVLEIPQVTRWEETYFCRWWGIVCSVWSYILTNKWRDLFRHKLWRLSQNFLWGLNLDVTESNIFGRSRPLNRQHPSIVQGGLRLFVVFFPLRLGTGAPAASEKSVFGSLRSWCAPLGNCCFSWPPVRSTPGRRGLGFRLALKGHADIGSDEEESKQGN